MNLGIPQIIVLLFIGSRLGIRIMKAQDIPDPGRRRQDIIASTIAQAITFGVLYWGGFFTPCGGP